MDRCRFHVWEILVAFLGTGLLALAGILLLYARHLGGKYPSSQELGFGYDLLIAHIVFLGLPAVGIVSLAGMLVSVVALRRWGGSWPVIGIVANVISLLPGVGSVLFILWLHFFD